MEELMGIDLNSRKFVCSKKQLNMIGQEEGCDIDLVENDIANDDDNFSDGEDFSSNDEPAYTDHKILIERSRREYIAVAVNSNRDPTNSRSKLAEIIGDDDEIITKNDINKDFATGFHQEIHNRYRGLSDFANLLANEKLAFQEISSGRIFKRCLMPGSGPQVDKDTMVIYNCAMWSEYDLEPFDSTWLRRNTIVCDLTEDSILPGIYELLLTMKKGEFCEAIIRPEAAFGVLGVMPRIPPNASIFVVLEVVKAIKRDKISWLTMNPNEARREGATFENFYQASDEARQRGNYYHSNKQYRPAIQRYRSGIKILETLTFKDEEEERKAKNLLLKLYNNYAKSANDNGEPRMALFACKQATLLSEHDDKTYWNRMKAWKLRGHYERALAIAHRAISFSSNKNAKAEFRKQIGDLNKKIEADQGDLKALYRLMGRALAC